MLGGLRAVLRSLFGLLPVKVTDQDLEQANPQVREALPVNFAAVAANGFFFPTAGKVVAAGLLLTWFVSELTPSAFWVGLIVPIQYGLSTLAEPIVANWLATKKRRVGYYTAQAVLRGGLWIGLAAASLLLGDKQPSLLLLIFFVIITADAVAAGVGTIVFNDTIGRVIPPQVRGRVRGWRGIFGGLVAGSLGLLIQTSFSAESGIRAYGILFIIAGVLYAIGGLVFGGIQEPETDPPTTQWLSLADTIARTRELLQDDNFRRFVLVQALLTPLVQGLPFFTLYAKQAFGLDISSLGVLVVISALTPIIASYIFGRLADHLGNRFTLIVSTLVGLLAPASVALLVGMNEANVRVIILVGLMVLAINAASVGFDLATKNYLLDLAENDQERPFYIGVNDVLIGLPTMLLVATGMIIDLFGFVPVFIGITMLAVLAVGLTVQLPRLRDKATAS